MSEKNLPSGGPRSEVLSPELQQQFKHREQVMGTVVEKLKPWLLEFGTWIFGGLIAFTLVIVATLLTVGPKDDAIILSIAIFAFALPLNVSGLFALKLIKDMNNLAFDDVMKQAFQDTAVAIGEVHLPPTEETASRTKRRTDVGLRYSVRLAVLSTVLTMLGMAAALWYMAWWIALIFCVMVIVSLIITMNMITGLMRPESVAERKVRPH